MKQAAMGWTTVIKPKARWFDINLKEVWEYKGDCEKFSVNMDTNSFL